jgi:S1-C subfamily serine protease
MKIRSGSMLTGIALAALLAASIPSGLRAQQQPPPPPAAPPASSRPDFGGAAVRIEDGSGWLGVAIEEVSADKANELKLPADRGVLLTEVEEDSPASKAGLKSGDVVTEFDGQRVEGTLAFRRMVRETPPGRSIELGYWRDGHAGSATVELGSLSSEFQDHERQLEDHAREMADNARQMADQQIAQQMAQMPMVLDLPEDADMFVGSTPTLGIGALNLSGQLGNYFGAPDGQGVLVSEVRDSTPASKAGLQAGDVITKLDGERVRSVGELRGKLAEKRADKSVTLTILRKGNEISISVEPQAPNPPKPALDLNHRMSM